MNDTKTEDKGKRSPISIELMAAAQAAYVESANEERAAKESGQKSQLALNSGWGGHGR